MGLCGFRCICMMPHRQGWRHTHARAHTHSLERWDLSSRGITSLSCVLKCFIVYIYGRRGLGHGSPWIGYASIHAYVVLLIASTVLDAVTQSSYVMFHPRCHHVVTDWLTALSSPVLYMIWVTSSFLWNNVTSIAQLCKLYIYIYICGLRTDTLRLLCGHGRCPIMSPSAADRPTHRLMARGLETRWWLTHWLSYRSLGGSTGDVRRRCGAMSAMYITGIGGQVRLLRTRAVCGQPVVSCCLRRLIHMRHTRIQGPISAWTGHARA